MLTLDRNYSSLAHSNPGLGRYLIPWRIPAIQGGKERNNLTLLEGRLDNKKGSSNINWDYEHNPVNSEKWEVSTSGLSRDGLSSCCCCQRLVQKDKVKGGKKVQDTQTPGKKHTYILQM